MENDKLFEKIEYYLNNQLSPEEVEAFENDIASDADLAMQVELQRFEKDGMELILEQELRGEVASWLSTVDLNTDAANTDLNNNEVESNPFRWILPFVLGGVILIAIYFFLPPDDEPTSNSINPVEEEDPNLPDPNDPRVKEFLERDPSEIPVADNKTPAEGNPSNNDAITQEPDVNPAVENMPSIDNAPVVAIQTNALEIASSAFMDDYLVDGGDNSILNDIAGDYEARAYENIITKVSENFKVGDENYLAAQEYLYAAYFKLKKFKEAEEVAKIIIRTGDPAYRARAEFNLLLAQVASEKTMSVDFTRMMDKIVNDPDHFGHRATKEIKEKGNY